MVHFNDAPNIAPEQIRDDQRLLPGEGVIESFRISPGPRKDRLFGFAKRGSVRPGAQGDAAGRERQVVPGLWTCGFRERQVFPRVKPAADRNQNPECHAQHRERGLLFGGESQRSLASATSPATNRQLGCGEQRFRDRSSIFCMKTGPNFFRAARDRFLSSLP